VEDVAACALGDENRAIIDESRELVAQWRAETEQASAAIPVEILSDREHRALRARRMRRVSAKWGFPTSLLITLLSELRSWRRALAIAQPANIGARIQHHYRAYFESLANLRARIDSEVAGTALATTARNDRDELPSKVLESPAALTGRLGRELEAQLAAGEQTPMRRRRFLCHLPALGVLGLAIWSRVYPLLDSITGSGERGFFSTLFSTLWSTLSPTFLVGILISIVLAYLVSAIVVWIREMQMLEGQIADGEQKVREEISRHGDKVIGAVDGRVQSLHDEFQQLRKVIQ
jgi:hypothetical protein